VLAAAAGADDDVGVGDVCRPAGGQEPAGVGRVHSVEADDVGAGRADQPARVRCFTRSASLSGSEVSSAISGLALLGTT
jgi:hypothetical protein